MTHPYLGDKPSKVKVYGDGLNSGWRNKHNSIFVDFRDSGLGELSLFVEGPSKAEVSMRQKEYGISEIDYVCSKSGKYKFYLRFDSQDIPGSPFQVRVI